MSWADGRNEYVLLYQDLTKKTAANANVADDEIISIEKTIAAAENP